MENSRFWVIFQPNVDGFCSNMGHFEAYMCHCNRFVVTVTAVTVTADHCINKEQEQLGPPGGAKFYPHPEN